MTEWRRFDLPGFALSPVEAASGKPRLKKISGSEMLPDCFQAEDAINP